MSKLKINSLASIMKFLIVLSLLVVFSPKEIQANNEIKVLIDGELMETDINPIIINSRVFVPFRPMFESLGASYINWDNSSRKIQAVVDSSLIDLQIDNGFAYINKNPIILDNPPIISNNRAFVPLRFIAESLGSSEVEWISAKKEIHITRSNLNNEIIKNRVSKKTISLGESADKIIEKFGPADRQDPSKYGFTWYIYNNDLSDYFQVGIYENKVVGFGTNSLNWKYDDFQIGEKHRDIDSSYNISHSFSKGMYDVEILADTHKDYIVSTIILVHERFANQSNYSPEVIYADSLQHHDLTNVYRVRNGLAPLERNTKLVELAQSHSLDMVEGDQFSHNSSDGRPFRDRAIRIWGTEYGIGENISAGYRSPLSSTNGLYNSIGHRKNILNRSYKLLGVGAAFNKARNTIYYTQNFSIAK